MAMPLRRVGLRWRATRAPHGDGATGQSFGSARSAVSLLHCLKSDKLTPLLLLFLTCLWIKPTTTVHYMTVVSKINESFPGIQELEMVWIA